MDTIRQTFEITSEIELWIATKVKEAIDKSENASEDEKSKLMAQAHDGMRMLNQLSMTMETLGRLTGATEGKDSELNG